MMQHSTTIFILHIVIPWSVVVAFFPSSFTLQRYSCADTLRYSRTFQLPTSSNYPPFSASLHNQLQDTSTPSSSWSVKDWSAALKTQNLPSKIIITEIIGQLPSSFPAGVLYKVGPARFENEQSQTSYAHWLEGDGAVSRLELFPKSKNNGQQQQASFTFRYVETDLYKSERRQGKILTRGTFGTAKDDGANLFDLKLKN
eukprot:8830633-Ditylum_brightwellii.AAC.1